MSLGLEENKILLSNGETLAYVQKGTGEKTLILVHGNMGSYKHWDLLISAMSDEYKIYALDMRGFGNSTYNKPADTIKEYAADLKLFADALGLTKFNLSGWSLGGAVCMQFAADFPEYVDKLVLLNSGNVKGYTAFKKNFLKKPIIGQYISTKQEIEKDIKMMIKAVEKRTKWLIKKVLDLTLFNVTKPSDNQVTELMDIVFQQKNLIDVNYALIHFNISNEHNGLEPGNGDVDKIVAPTLVLQGDRDVIITVDVAKEIVKAIGDNAKLVVLDGCSHFALLDNIEKVKKEYVEFIG